MIFTTIIFLALCIVNYRIARFWLYPPFLFSVIWLAATLGLTIAGNLFYPISVKTQLIFILGAFFFSLGGLAVSYIFHSVPALTDNINRIYRQRLNTSLDILVLILLIGLPFYWLNIYHSYTGVDLKYLLPVIRNSAVIASGQPTTFNPLSNFVLISYYTVIVVYYETDQTFRKKFRFILTLLLALIYGILTGSKANAPMIIIGLFSVKILKSRKLTLPNVIVVALILLVIFFVGLLSINYIYTDPWINLAADFKNILLIIVDYWVGGLVAFDRIVSDPNAIPLTQNITRFFFETANSLGFNYDIPSLHAQFVAVSPLLSINTYTLYFTYFPQLGLTITLLLMFFIGGLTTWIYNLALNKSLIAIFFCALLVYPIVKSVQSEYFFLNLNGYIKAFIFALLIFNLPKVGQKIIVKQQ